MRPYVANSRRTELMFKEDTNHKPEGIKGTVCSNKRKTDDTDLKPSRCLEKFPEKLEGMSTQDLCFPSMRLKHLEIGDQTVIINPRA